MNKETINVSVFGPGTMGSGIAQLFATKGFNVKVYVRNEEELNALNVIPGNLKILKDNDIIKESEIPEIMSRIQTTESFEEAAKSADIVFESIIENLEIKQDYFSRLDEICGPDTILASNTSVISITEIAEKSKNKHRIIGTHFWNPPYIVPLVEVIKTEYISEDVVERTVEILEKAGKKPVVVNKDVPGFLANRLQHALFREAISIIENGIADAKAVDDSIKYGFGLRIPVTAPMEVIDMGGIDLTYAIHSYLFKHLENSTEPSPLLVEKLNNKELGFKTGLGFQKWTKEDQEASRKNLIENLIKVAKTLDRL